MRLVSAYYGDFYPFETINHVTDFAVAVMPDELAAGDILVVWGGADIHPSLYKKGRSQKSGAYSEPSKRDMIEWNLMQRAKELGCPIIGVCRGAQMLCALAGGYLIQHVNNHSGYHEVTTHDGEIIKVNSIHHQMMAPENTNHELIAWTSNPLSDVYWDENTLVDRGIEPELVYFNDVKGFAVQWHPEMMSVESKANEYFIKFIEERL